MCYVNNNLGNINSRLDTSLSSSVLDYALTLPEGMHTVRFPGDSYTGADTPNSYYRYSGATIIVRSKGKVVTVLLYGISTKAPLAVNSYDGGKWKGWDQYVTKDDLTPTSEAIAQPLVSGITFSQWIVTAEKSGNEVTLSFNVNGNMTATSSIVKILTLPTKYRPKSNKYVSYATQEGYIMLLAIYTDGTLNLFNNNKAVSGFFLRQTISYPAE